jgi:hypothetical protein
MSPKNIDSYLADLVQELKLINEIGGVEIIGKSNISSEGILLRCTSESFSC